MENFESKPSDLIVAKKDGKCAIFNIEHSVFLTDHIYDGILLSKSNYHIVFNASDLINDDGTSVPKMGEITYSAIVDNFGKVTEYPNLVFGYNGVFSEYGVCPALEKLTNKVYLVNHLGLILSSGYDRIVPVNREHNYGLYYGINYCEPTYNPVFNREIKVCKLLNHTGEEIPLSIPNSIFDFDNIFDVLELNNIENIEKFISEYGANIIELIPKNMFKIGENYYKIFNAVNLYGLKNEVYSSQLLYTISFLENKANQCVVTNFVTFNKDLIPENIASKNRIEQNYIKKNLYSLYLKIGLIKGGY